MTKLTDTGCFGYINDMNPLCTDCETGVDCMVQQNNAINVVFNIPKMEDSAYIQWMEQVAKDVDKALKDFSRKYWRL